MLRIVCSHPMKNPNFCIKTLSIHEQKLKHDLCKITCHVGLNYEHKIISLCGAGKGHSYRD